MFSNAELRHFISTNMIMFFAGKTLYQLHSSVNAGYSFTKVRRLKERFTLPGKFYAMDPEHANKYYGA